MYNHHPTAHAVLRGAAPTNGLRGAHRTSNAGKHPLPEYTLGVMYIALFFEGRHLGDGSLLLLDPALNWTGWVTLILPQSGKGSKVTASMRQSFHIKWCKAAELIFTQESTPSASERNYTHKICARLWRASANESSVVVIIDYISEDSTDLS